ncbi:MAG TPA: hypothetical protein VF035_09910 [Longimicrobiales bacterium]
MKASGYLKLAAAAIIPAIAGGCASNSQEGPIACTLIGCEAGLAVDVKGDRGGDVSVKVTAADGQSRTFECEAEAATCSAFFADYMPANVTVTVTKQESNTVRSFAVTYGEVHPNGEACPPVCRQGRVDVIL